MLNRRRWRRWRTAAFAVTASAGAACSVFDFLQPHRGVESNSLIWHVAGSPSPGPPAYDGQRVFFSTRTHTVVALDKATGRNLWSARADSEATELHGSSFAGCTVAGPVVACGDNGDLVGLRRDNGAFAWRFHAPTGGRPDWNQPVALNNTLYAGSGFGGALYALDAATGELRWTAVVPSVASTEGLVLVPAADTGLVVAPYLQGGKPTTGGLIAVDARTGVVRWNTAIPRIAPDSDTGGYSVALWRNMALVSAQSGRIFAIDRASGAIVWSLPGVGARPPSSSLRGNPMTSDFRNIVVAGDRLYASSYSGWFIAYDLTKHEEIARTDPKIEGAQGSPIVSDGNAVYVVYLTGAVVVFSASDGSVKSMAGRAGGPLIVEAALGSDRFFVPGDDGFYAFRK